ncbi:sensor histidine kinase [Phytomonospora endophytica]|uniref:histidine kinase n=1 Tax=Phytomonospora endophytica TaxID=714109 RepID=A0A841FS96_9ACTN|nr:sensor histidine kinase [Phytomonospora endophytica]MBB6035409.1 signal transduction histidine kinase [Phytomonospora endophytica]
MVKSWWPPRGRAADALVALAVWVAVLGVALISLGNPERQPESNSWLAWPLITISAAVLYWRRDHPIAVALVTLVCNALYYPFTGPDGIIVLAFLVALYTVAAESSLIAATLLAVVPMLVIVSVEARSQRRHLDDVAVFMLAGWLVAIVAVGGVVQNRRAYLAEAEERARAAERAGREESRLRASEERLRIARELHDVIGHNISLINVQAGAALHRFDADRAEAALVAIKDTSKQALRELRSTLGVLRQVDEEAPVAPAPGLGALGTLAERTRATGLDVTVEVAGEPKALPTEVDLAAYRIVQESLTNVTKHAAATTVTVRVDHGADRVVVEILDNGTGGAGTPGSTGSAGHGIVGMGERARALGGSLDAAVRPGGGFAVRAVLPLDPNTGGTT